MKISYTILLVSIFIQPMYAQNLPSFKHYNIKGLAPESVINTMYQDKDGFLWFGGLTGLYRYDGNILTRFQHNVDDSTSLPHNYIVDFCEDETGKIVCGSLGGGIFMVDKATGKSIKPAADQLQKLEKDKVVRMVSHSSSSPVVWCGSSSGDLIKYDPVTKHFQIVFSLHDSFKINNATVSAVLEMQAGKLLVASSRGLYYLDINNKNAVHASAVNIDLKNLDTLEIRSLLLDNERRIWVGYKGGVAVIDAKSFDPLITLTQIIKQNLGNLTVKALCQLSDGQILLGTNSGIFCWNNETTNLTNLAVEDKEFKQSPQIINSFYTDRRGNVWAATETQGIFLLNKNYSFFKTIPDLKQLMKPGKLEAIMEDATGNWWLGSDNGLVRFNKRINKAELITLDKKRTASVLSIFQDDKKGVWFGTIASGLYYMPDPAKPSVLQHFNKLIINEKPDVIDYVTSINEDNSGNMWFGCFTNGIFIYNIEAKKFIHYVSLTDSATTNNAAISQILKDKQGYMWVSTWNNGFNKFISTNNFPSEGKFINYTTSANNPNSLSFQISSAIKEDRYGNLWIGTVSGGLNKFDPKTKNFTRLSIDNGLSSNLVYRIEEDKQGNIWFSTDEGITMLPQNLSSPVSFKEEDGLPTRSFNFLASYAMRDGTVAFGTIDGDVVFFQPEKIEKNNQAPAIINFQLFNRSLKVGELNIFRKPVQLADTFNLKYDQSVFTFEFSNFDFINPENYVYAYKLDGVDKDWNNVNNRKSATYTSLSPGKYLFHLKAANHKGVWSDKETIAWIIISPPWWRTWWAYASYAILIILAITAYNRYRSRQLRKENVRLEENVLLRTNELQKSLHELKSTQAQLIQSEKMASLGELTAGIAHEIQNPLNFVNNFSEVNTEMVDEATEEIDKGNYDEVKIILHDIKDNSEKINHHGKRADAIVKGMLQHSQKSTGVKEAININALCDEYLRLAYHGLKAKDKNFNVTMQTNFDSNIGKVNIVPQDVGRVLLNLFNNAFYATNEKKKTADENYQPTVSVQTKKISNKVEIKVSDNGNGISQKIVDKIFQPFFTTKPTGEGTGLGLSLSYDIIKAHGGDIKVETKENEGTTFILNLPITF
jgi:signal transduction histidine kinase/ligand-binding sensor domain-containing protein